MKSMFLLPPNLIPFAIKQKPASFFEAGSSFCDDLWTTKQF
jgi:hypothetical protein